MRTAILMAALAAAQPAEACHRFSVWKYPTPQRCEVANPQVDRSWYVQFVLPDVGKGPEAKPPVVPRFTVNKYNTIILDLDPGTSDEDGRAQAIELLKQVMGR